MQCKDYENRKKPKKQKSKDKELKKYFQVSNYRFFPCNWTVNIKEGYQYYLLIKSCTNLPIHENDSPKFKSEKEAREFAQTNKNYSLVLG
jgi:hypothetical protein